MQLINRFFMFSAEYLYLLAVILAVLSFLTLSRQQKKELIRFAIITLPVMYIVSKLAGLLYYDPRPFVVTQVPPLIPHEPDNGFPSDHVLLIAALASLLFPLSSKTAALVFFLALLVGIISIYTSDLTNLGGKVQGRISQPSA